MKPVTHIVNVSGGKDSTAVYLLAVEKGIPFRAVHGETGNEHPWTDEYIDRLHERTGGPKVERVRADFSKDMARKRRFILEKWAPALMAGKPGTWAWIGYEDIESSEEVLFGPLCAPPAPLDPYKPAAVEHDLGVWKWTPAVPPMSEDEAHARVERAAALMKPTGNPYLDLCIWKGRFPSRKAQFCTEELKTWPITDQVVLPALRNGPVLQWLGIRADESLNRSKQPRFNRHESGSYLWRPIFNWTVDDVWAMHKKHGVERNPLYDNGMGRVGCMPCINCKKDELRQIATRFPEHIDRIREWENIVVDAAKRGAATFFPAVTDPTDPDRPGTFSRIDKLVEWSKTGRGGRQYAMFFEEQAGGGCTSNLGACEQ